jgi:hypothetical protein
MLPYAARIFRTVGFPAAFGLVPALIPTPKWTWIKEKELSHQLYQIVVYLNPNSAISEGLAARSSSKWLSGHISMRKAVSD